MDGSGPDETHHNTKRKLDEEHDAEGTVKRPKASLAAGPAEQPEQPPAPGLLHLSDDVLLCILRHCPPHHLRALSFCCRRLSSLCRDRALWRRVDLRTRRLGTRALACYVRAMPPRTTLALCVRGLVGRPRKENDEENAPKEKKGEEDPVRSNSSYVVTSDGSTFCDITVNHRIVLNDRRPAPQQPEPPRGQEGPRRSASDGNLFGGRFGYTPPPRPAAPAPTKDAKNALNESIKKNMSQSCSGELPGGSRPRPDCEAGGSGNSAPRDVSGKFDTVERNVEEPGGSGGDAAGPSDNVNKAGKHSDKANGDSVPSGSDANASGNSSVAGGSTDGLGGSLGTPEKSVDSLRDNLNAAAGKVDETGSGAEGASPGDGAGCSGPQPTAGPSFRPDERGFLRPEEGGGYASKENGGNSSPRPYDRPASPPSTAGGREGAAGRAAGAEEPDGDLTVTKEMMLTIRRKCPGLKELRLEYCYIDCSIIQPSVFPPTLETLSLRGCVCRNVPFSRSYLFRIQDYCPLLSELDLSRCGWLASHSLLVLSKMPRLRRLSLRGCWGLGECVAYASLSARYGFRSLEVLDIRGTPMGDSEVSAFSLIGSLRELYLQAVGAGAEGGAEGERPLEDPRDEGQPQLWEAEDPLAGLDEEEDEETEPGGEPPAPPPRPEREPPAPGPDLPIPEDANPFGVPNRVHVIYVDVQRARNMRVLYAPGAPQNAVVDDPAPVEEPEMPDIQIRMRNAPDEHAFPHIEIRQGGPEERAHGEQNAFPQVEIRHEVNRLPYGLHGGEPFPEVEIRRDEADRPLNVRVRFGGPGRAIEIPFARERADEPEPPEADRPGEFIRRGPGFLMMPHLVGREEVVFADHEMDRAARDRVVIEERLNPGNREPDAEPDPRGEFIRRGPDFVMLPNFGGAEEEPNIVMHLRRPHQPHPGQDINIEVQIGQQGDEEGPPGRVNVQLHGDAPPEAPPAQPEPHVFRRGLFNVQVYHPLQQAAPGAPPANPDAPNPEQNEAEILRINAALQRHAGILDQLEQNAEFQLNMHEENVAAELRRRNLDHRLIPNLDPRNPQDAERLNFANAAVFGGNPAELQRNPAIFVQNALHLYRNLGGVDMEPDERAANLEREAADRQNAPAEDAPANAAQPEQNGAGAGAEPDPDAPNFHWRAENILALMRGVQRDLNRNRRVVHWPFVRRGHEDTSRLVTDASLLRFGISENVVHIGGAPPPARVSSLRALVCRGYSRVTDRALSHLAAAAPHLTSLDLSHTAVTAEGARSFRSMRPDCTLICQHLAQ